MFIYSIKWERKIRNFHIAVKRRLRNVQKMVMHVQSCCFAKYKPIAFLPFSMQISRSSRLRRGLQENKLRYLICPRSLRLPFWTVLEFTQNEKWGNCFPTPHPRVSFRVRLSWEFSRLPQMESLLAGESDFCACTVYRYMHMFSRTNWPLIKLILVKGFLSESIEINLCVHTILKTIIIFNLDLSWR